MPIQSGSRTLAWALLLLASQSALAGTDVVEFINGDRLTGEVKSLDRGQLKFDADATGVISIKWEDVASLDVDASLQVETQNGDRFFGPLSRSDDAHVIIIEAEQGTTIIQSEQVVAIDQIDGAGLRNIDLSVSVGYNYTNASNVTQFNVGIDSAYRTRQRILSGNFDSSISNSTGNDVSQRQSLSMNYTRLRANRWLNDGGLSFDRNDELGLNLRTSLSAGGGRILSQSNSSNLVLKGGLKATRENNADQPEDVDSLESYGLIAWEWFRYDSPKLDWSTSIEIIPSLTESGRVRGEFDITLSWEVIGDLSWQLDFYDSYDNRPQSDTTPKNDYGITTSLSYDF
jgi:hypothetical protein